MAQLIIYIVPICRLFPLLHILKFFKNIYDIRIEKNLLILILLLSFPFLSLLFSPLKDPCYNFIPSLFFCFFQHLRITHIKREPQTKATHLCNMVCSFFLESMKNEKAKEKRRDKIITWIL